MENLLDSLRIKINQASTISEVEKIDLDTLQNVTEAPVTKSKLKKKREIEKLKKKLAKLTREDDGTNDS